MELKPYIVGDNYLLNTEEELNEIVSNAIDLGFSEKEGNIRYIEFSVNREQEHNVKNLLETKATRYIANITEDSMKSLQESTDFGKSTTYPGVSKVIKELSGVNLRFIIKE